MEAHDYKFAEAIFDNYGQFPESGRFAQAGAGWRARFLSAGMAYFKAPTKRPVPIVAEAIELLKV
jgi:hypothetical protein